MDTIYRIATFVAAQWENIRNSLSLQKILSGLLLKATSTLLVALVHMVYVNKSRPASFLQTISLRRFTMLWNLVMKILRVFLETEVEISAMQPGDELPLDTVKGRVFGKGFELSMNLKVTE